MECRAERAHIHTQFPTPRLLLFAFAFASSSHLQTYICWCFCSVRGPWPMYATWIRQHQCDSPYRDFGMHQNTSIHHHDAIAHSTNGLARIHSMCSFMMMPSLRALLMLQNTKLTSMGPAAVRNSYATTNATLASIHGFIIYERQPQRVQTYTTGTGTGTGPSYDQTTRHFRFLL